MVKLLVFLGIRNQSRLPETDPQKPPFFADSAGQVPFSADTIHQILFFADNVHHKDRSLQIPFITKTVLCRYRSSQRPFFADTVHYKDRSLQIPFITKTVLCRYRSLQRPFFADSNRLCRYHLCCQKPLFALSKMGCSVTPFFMF